MEMGALELAVGHPYVSAHTGGSSPMPSGSVACGPNAQKTAEYRRKHLVYCAALCWCMFANDRSDATAGLLLPRIQAQYNVSINHAGSNNLTYDAR